MVTWIKARMEAKPLNTPMYDALESSTLIDTQLEMMMNELECDRIWIAQFHNGGYFYPTGRSIQKFSIFYEKCTPPTSSTPQTPPITAPPEFKPPSNPQLKQVTSRVTKKPAVVAKTPALPKKIVPKVPAPKRIGRM